MQCDRCSTIKRGQAGMRVSLAAREQYGIRTRRAQTNQAAAVPSSRVSRKMSLKTAVRHTPACGLHTSNATASSIDAVAGATCMLVCGAEPGPQRVRGNCLARQWAASTRSPNEAGKVGGQRAHEAVVQEIRGGGGQRRAQNLQPVAGFVHD